MKLLLDFFPVAVFVAVYFTVSDRSEAIYTATGAIIVASAIQVGANYLVNKKFDRMQLITLALLGVFGGLTLVLRDPTFIKWKPTVVNWLFAVVFAASHFVGAKPLFRRMMEPNLPLPDVEYTRLSVATIAFFLFLGALNLAVAFNFDEATWVSFKLYGFLGLTFAFFFGMFWYLRRYFEEPVEGDG